MDLPDCPPGAEGYQDSVTEVPKKPEDTTCTKAEQEFHEHLNSLKIKLEDGTYKPMVERHERDVAGKWIYLCYPCAAVCSGESILQTHISGKKHKIKLSMTNAWPMSIFEEHPYHQQKTSGTEKGVPKVVQEVDLTDDQKHTNELDAQFGKYKNTVCQIQESLDAVKAPLIGLEYLIEHPPEQEHYEPKYICTLCSKQGHPRTIINHITCFWHRYNFILRHFSKACNLLTPYRSQPKYREAVGIVINRLAQRIEDKYGRKRPINIDKEEYEKEKDLIHQWIFKGHHFVEQEGCTFEEVVDIGLIDSLHSQSDNPKDRIVKRKEPSPPIVAAPSKPHFNHFSRPAGRQERRTGSVESLSDISDDGDADFRRDSARSDRLGRDRHDRRAPSPYRTRYAIRNNIPSSKTQDKTRAPNYEYKVKLAADKRAAAEEFAKKTLAYHEKNPEKHPLYPEEWKKFWNKRYKEIQAEGKDPSKHDFKPEWIVFWTARMKVLHDEELRITVNEIYRKMCLPPPEMREKSPEPARRVSEGRRRSPPEKRRRSPDLRRRSPDLRRRTPEQRRRSPDLRRRSPDLRRRSPELRRRSPDLRHRSPLRRRSPDSRRDRRSPNLRRSPGRRRSIDRHRSPLPPPPPYHSHRGRSRSRSPIRRHSPGRGRVPEPLRRSRSPLSQRSMQPRNRSPEHVRDLAPCMQTVLISDDELKPDDGLSPWNSDNEIGSVGSIGSINETRSRAGSSIRRGSRPPGAAPRRRAPPPGGPEPAAPDDVVATLRLLVALEDYLGSLGPKLVDLLAEALKMEKEKANSSEELLARESALVLMETAKEKLKGAAQAGLVTGSAAAAARAAVVRAAATLHEADERARRRAQTTSDKASKSAVPVAGVGEVDRAQIAQQMAEALIAQGKTDVSSEELAQLVDAVVGMAEAKKREAEKRQPEVRPAALRLNVVPIATLQKPSGTASALQMLQSAYDENDKKVEKDDAPDAMDGLSDSDLETLLKNFNELSAEEQHSLIAYLKKLEAREPARVERLRQYVSDAAHVPAGPGAGPAPRPPRPDEPLVLESDDDDYTVEEVFQSATQKVREDQMRQEMEIVKKSLEESQPAVTTTNISSIVDITRNLSSASDLFALVQASIKSTPAPTPAPMSQPPEVVASSSHPRSFGDLPEAPMTSNEPAKPTNIVPLMSIPIMRQPLQNLLENNRNMQPLQPPSNDDYNQGKQPSNDRFSPGNQSNNDRFSSGNEESNDRFTSGNQSPSDRFSPGNKPPNDRCPSGNQLANDRFSPGTQPPNDRFNQGNQPPNDRFNQGGPPPNDRFNQSGPPSNDRFKQGGPPSNDRFNQGGPPTNARFNLGGQPPNERFNPGGQPPNERFNPGGQPPNERFNPGGAPPNERFNPGGQPPNERFNPGGAPPNERFKPGGQPPNERFNPGGAPPNERFNPGGQPPNERFNPGGAPPNERFNPGGQPPNERFNPGGAPPNERFNPGGAPPNERFNPGGQPPNERFNPGGQPPNERFNPGGAPPNERFNPGGQPPNERFNPGGATPKERFNPGGPPPNERFNPGGPPPNDRINPGGPPPNDRFNPGGPPPNERFNPAGPAPNERVNAGGPLPNERFKQGGPQSNDSINQGDQPSNDRFNQGEPPATDRFNQGNQPPNDRFNQGNQPPSDRFNQCNQPANDRFNQGNQPPNERLNQGNQPPNDRFNPGTQPPPNEQFNQGIQPPPNEHFNQGNQGNQWNGRPMDNRGPPIRGHHIQPLLGAPDNFVPIGQFIQGPRMNFMNIRGQDNFDIRPPNMNIMNQQFGNFENQNNFRGRGGRGHRGPMRGRGRGFF